VNLQHFDVLLSGEEKPPNNWEDPELSFEVERVSFDVTVAFLLLFFPVEFLYGVDTFDFLRGLPGFFFISSSCRRISEALSTGDSSSWSNFSPNSELLPMFDDKVVDSTSWGFVVCLEEGFFLFFVFSLDFRFEFAVQLVVQLVEKFVWRDWVDV
jgi:hypothetical protein